MSRRKITLGVGDQLDKAIFESEALHLYVDGACRRKDNQLMGGWGAVFMFEDQIYEIRDSISGIDSQGAEILAASMGLRYARQLHAGEIVVFSDSQSVVKTLSDRRATPKTNMPLWHQLRLEASRGPTRFEWVKGHSTSLGNQRADQLAGEAINYTPIVIIY